MYLSTIVFIYCKMIYTYIIRASDISRKKNQNFAGFSGQIHGKIGRFRGILADKNLNFEGFSGANS